jgi:hypothetical protein
MATQPAQSTTRVEYLQQGWGWKQIEFQRWTPMYLVLRYPNSGKDWLISQKQLQNLVAGGSLRIEGAIPAAWQSIVARDEQRGYRHQGETKE